MLGGAWHFVSEHFGAIGALVTFVASIGYSRWETRHIPQVVLAWLIMSLGLFVFVANTILPERTIDFGQAISFLVMFGSALYAVLCDALRFGMAAYLTRKRGEKWIKELDYVYLTLGAFGVVGSMNRLELAGGHYTQLDLLAPLVLTSAIVIRLVKTRADIEGWNKQKEGS